MEQKDIYLARQKQLLGKIPHETAIVLFGAQEKTRNDDVVYPFRQNSNFYYFTGYSEPDAVAVLLIKRQQVQFILFNQLKEPEKERWIGPRIGQEAAVTNYGADLAFDIRTIDEKIIELVADCEKIFYEMGKNKSWDNRVLAWTSQLHAKNKKGTYYPLELVNFNVIAQEMRVKKDAHEIELMRKAAEYSAQAHIAVMKQCQPQMYEYQLEAVLNYELINKGCRSQAYQPIVGGGTNACILHYIENSSKLRSGDLVLVDAGGEFQNYAADITRTFPVNGRFSKEQAAVYNLVLKAQLAVINQIRPGLRWDKLQELTISILVEGLVSLGILKGEVEQIINKKTYLEFYMHNVSHWLGMDVHDAGLYRLHKEPRELEPGMVLTVEPGLYLSANSKIDKKWWDIGVRIEDDVLVTSDGCEVLSAMAPKTISQIEALMAKESGISKKDVSLL